ncbi:TetR/AcrR family transcriptional regulator [Leucobacter sp. M11]|uniref:TetR/AcrR family transcriptional regulator n=1 Tax=Leucobacter sp. M11 TaxID=2993565 RepID=UPI002D809011|nr:TetR family transcriptional regulator [Leucobacter sp. M11]MEB4616110.1 TetR family transcriptional regulator [Leucobacter sp. M11]
MAWDTERTRTLLLDAATVEFSAHGFAGARIDRIATAAGVNKERIYPYFGGKLGLFDAVLDRALDDFLGAAPPPGTGAEALAAYAGALFDAYAASPALPRLLAWEGLELAGDAEATLERQSGCAAKVAQIADSFPGLNRERAAELLVAIVALVTSHWSLPQLPAMIQGRSATPGERRAAITTQVRALAEAEPEASPDTV